MVRVVGDNPANRGRYALGHGDTEIDRLETQARIVAAITRRFWLAAGVRPGMHVLDVGCGAGHTSLLLAELVGQEGRVVGVDNAADAVAAARARSRDVDNVEYVHADPTRHHFDHQFDAVVGRYVLMFQPDPAAFLRALVRHAQPHGIVSFHELDFNGVSSRPPVTVFDQATRWNVETSRRYGADPHCGSHALAIYLAAGLPAPTVSVETVHGRGRGAVDVLTRMRNLTRSLLTEMQHQGVATADQVDIDTLLDRMLTEAAGNESLVTGPAEVGAYCTR